VPQNSKRIVVDTDIASSASGELAYDTRPKQCRDFLIAVKDNKHSVVLTEAIHEEWRKHQSKFTRTWLVSMYARRLVSHIEAPADDKLRRKVEQAAISQKKSEAMLKDVHLVEAALQTDKIVTSLDETVRQCFHKATSTIVILKQIAWANPCKEDENVIEWLERGAEREKERRLGYNKEE
jgi:hypothetical protein